MSLDAALDAARAQETAALERLFALLRFPSVSTDPAHDGDCRAAAEWLVAELAGLGFEAALRETGGKPAVVAHHRGDGPRLLFYGHYDVQPADPLELWDGDPFEPALVATPGGPVIRARGAGDDKGQLMTFVEAFRAWKDATGGLPGNISVLLEGEEEIGSPSLAAFLEAHREELAADLCMVCDTPLFDARTPAITAMLRGIATAQVTVRGPNRDLHSGFYGGAAMNPIRALTAVLGRLHDDRGRVTIPGFYDGVDPVPEELRAMWDRLPIDAEGFLGDVGLSTPAGEADASLLEQVWARPTAEINGIWGGYTGTGFKTVLPAEAHAKVSFRLVGRQDPAAVQDAFERFLRAGLPDDCTLEFRRGHGAPAAVMPTDRPEFETARAALGAEWPNDAVFVGGGGSIPVVGDFRRILGADSMLIGFGRDNDNIHSPNEKYDLQSFRRGTRAWVRILGALAG